jgi:hypothetical protein
MVTKSLGKFSPLLYTIRICNSNNVIIIITIMIMIHLSYLHIYALTQQQRPITEAASIKNNKDIYRTKQLVSVHILSKNICEFTN